MDKLQVAEFRTTFRDDEMSEPVEVFRFKKRVGTWYPDGTEPVLTSDSEAGLLAEIKYLKSELAKRLTTKVPDPVGPRGYEVVRPVNTNAIAAGSGPEHRGVSPGGFGHSSPAPKP